MPNLLLSLAAAAARWLPAPAKKFLYRWPPLARFIRGSLNRAAPNGLTQAKVAGGGLQGAALLLDLQSEKDYWLGTYEPELQQAVAEMVCSGWIAYDVGANIGYISLLLAQAVGDSGKVYAFEALPANLERLRANVALNARQDRVQVVPAAVVDRPGPVNFLVGPSGGMGKAAGSAGRQNVPYTETISVPGISLDEFIYTQGNPPPQVVKIDVEGGEVMVLPGMQRLLRTEHPLLLLELHGPEAADMAWRVLSGSGYKLCRMEPGFPAINSRAELDWKAYLAAVPVA